MVDHRRFTTLALVFLALFTQVAFAQRVTRGPYLQVGTDHSIIVRWQTDKVTDSRVSYGTLKSSLSLTANDSEQTKEHIVRVGGLSPDTRYFYSVGSSSTVLAGGDDAHFFLTSPTPGTSKPTRIWILGDSGTADNKARAVRDAYYQFTGNRHTDLWLMLGDNAYSKGSVSEYQKAVFEDMYEAMLIKSSLWPTLGNHDDGTSSSPGPYPYYDIFTLPKSGEAGGMPSGTEAYYAFDYGNIHFICLNSSTRNLRGETSAMWTWLDEDLASNDKDWTIAFWHHPPYTKGSHDSDKESELLDMRERAVPRLEASGVDLVLGGHSHSYERSFLLDSHYGKSGSLSDSHILDGGDGRDGGDGAYEKQTLGPAAHEGAVYLVNGSSGKTSGGSLDHPVMVTSMNELGSLVLDIDDNRLDATFLDDRGDVRDTFTVIKGSTTPRDPATQLVLVSGDGQSGPVGSTLPQPFVVEVRDQNNRPVGSVAVTFRITRGDATLSSSTSVTGANGRASTVLTFGSETGEHTVTASVSGLAGSPVTFHSDALQENDPPPAPPVNVRIQVAGE